MSLKSASPLSTSWISCFRASRPSIRRPLFPASVYVRTMALPRLSEYLRMTSLWFSVEYCWCSVDMRTYSAARVTSRVAGGEGESGGGGSDLSIYYHSSGKLGSSELMKSPPGVGSNLTQGAPL